MAAVLDGSFSRVLLLPYFFHYFLFSLWHTSLGALDAFWDLVSGRTIEWQKTERFRQS